MERLGIRSRGRSSDTVALEFGASSPPRTLIGHGLNVPPPARARHLETES